MRGPSGRGLGLGSPEKGQDSWKGERKRCLQELLRLEQTRRQADEVEARGFGALRLFGMRWGSEALLYLGEG
jgi:hypothetical protein